MLLEKTFKPIVHCTAGVHTEKNDELEATSSSQSVVKTLFDGNIMHPLHHSFNSVKQNKAKRIELLSLQQQQDQQFNPLLKILVSLLQKQYLHKNRFLWMNMYFRWYFYLCNYCFVVFNYESTKTYLIANPKIAINFSFP